jgi:hypothetical protein
MSGPGILVFISVVICAVLFSIVAGAALYFLIAETLRAVNLIRAKLRFHTSLILVGFFFLAGSLYCLIFFQ